MARGSSPSVTWWAALLALASVAAVGEPPPILIDNGILTVSYDVDLDAFTIAHGGRVFAEGERFGAGSGIEVKVIEIDDAMGRGKAIEERDAMGISVWLALYDTLPLSLIHI